MIKENDRVIQVSGQYGVTKKGWKGTVVDTALTSKIVGIHWDNDKQFHLVYKKDVKILQKSLNDLVES